MKNITNSLQDITDQDGRLLIEDAIMEALRALGVGPDDIPYEEISKAAAALWGSSIKFLVSRNRYLATDSHFFHFAEKAVANLALLRDYDVDGLRWARVLFKKKQLFNQNPETIRANFTGNLEWMKNYGATGKALMAAALRQPVLFTRKAESLRKNFLANLKWLKTHGISGEAWMEAALRQPILFYIKPERLEQNFSDNLAWLKAYGISGEAWASIALKYPQFLYKKPETLRAAFELLLALSETEAFRLPEKRGPDNRKTRIAWLLANPVRLGFGEDNLLLRLAFAEIAQPKPAASLLNDRRKAIEAKLLQVLGYADKKIPPLDGSERMPPETKRERRDSLIKELHAYADDVRKEWRAHAGREEKFKPARPITSVLLPKRERRAGWEKTALLANNLVLGGLVKSARIAP